MEFPPGIARGCTFGWLSPVPQKTPTPLKPMSDPITARTVVNDCPKFEDRLSRSPGTPLVAEMTIPRRTSNSLMDVPYSGSWLVLESFTTARRFTPIQQLFSGVVAGLDNELRVQTTEQQKSQECQHGDAFARADAQIDG